MARSFFESAPLIVSSGDASSTAPDISLPRGARLQHATLAILGVSNGPVRGTISLFPNGKRLGSQPLKGGWIRTPTTVPDSGSLSWDGDILVGEGAEVEATVRNDTGVEVTLLLRVSGVS